MQIRRATQADVQAVTALALELWPDHNKEEFAAEFSALLEKSDVCIALAVDVDKAVGFAQCGVRRDYVEGTDNSPVAYIEGVYVQKDYRMHGVARQLLWHCEQWARAQGLHEIASDCELVNDDSHAFHLHMGFEEANQIVCFVKKL